jgi:predicted membrane protein DUF2142
VGPGWDRRALACLCFALLALAGSLGLALAQRAPRRAGTNGVWVRGETGAAAGQTACQGRELVPAGTATIQIGGTAHRAPLLTLRREGRTLARIRTTIPSPGLIEASIRPPARDLRQTEVCLTFRSPATLYDGPTPPNEEGLSLGRGFQASSMAINYMQPGRPSWAAYAPAIERRLQLGRGDWTRGWALWLIVALVASSLLLAAGLVVRTIVASRPTVRAAWVVMAIATCNAAAWSLITPAFQVPDEVAHIAYVQSIGETGAPPFDPRSIVLSFEQVTAMADSRFGSVDAPTLHTAVWARSQQHRLTRDLHLPLSRLATAEAGEKEPEPPLYYTLEAVPYRLAHGATLLDRITLMRLGSALLAGITALLCFLFVRELLPGRPWAWAVGGLGVAFTPMLGFISGGVNPDALLFATAAGLFLLVARAWRRGVTVRLALGIGALIAVGMLAKVNFYGLAPGALLGLLLAARRSEAAWNRRVALRVGGAALLAGGLFALGVAFQVVVWDRPFVVGRPAAPESHVGLLQHASFIWQVFLPRLPFQARAFRNYPAYDQLFKTFVGAFGWLQAWQPTWVYRLAAGELVVIGVLAVRALAANPRELRFRRGELLGYVAMTAVLLLLIGLSADLRRNILRILQGRYLLPLLPLFGALLAMGARGLGERWGRAVGVAIVATTVAWTLYGQFVTITFFYS